MLMSSKAIYFQSTLRSYWQKLKAWYTVSEVLCTLIQESWIHKQYTIGISGGDMSVLSLRGS